MVISQIAVHHLMNKVLSLISNDDLINSISLLICLLILSIALILLFLYYRRLLTAVGVIMGGREARNGS